VSPALLLPVVYLLLGRNSYMDAMSPCKYEAWEVELKYEAKDFSRAAVLVSFEGTKFEFTRQTATSDRFL
jgi:hypothetical protein